MHTVVVRPVELRRPVAQHLHSLSILDGGARQVGGARANARDDGIVEAAISALSERTVESMLEYYLGSACVLRLEIARELAKRELNKEQLEQVQAFLVEESSQVIYDVLSTIR